GVVDDVVVHSRHGHAFSAARGQFGLPSHLGFLRTHRSIYRPSVCGKGLRMHMSSGGVAFALSHATLEGKTTISVLPFLSLVRWTVIINKFRQLAKARKRNQLFLGYYSKGKGPLVIFRKGPINQLQGSPMYELYYGGCEELKSQQEK